MTYLILIALIFCAIGAAAYYGSKYRQVVKDLDESETELLLKEKIIFAMKKAAQNQELLYKKLDEVANAKTVADLSAIYNKLFH